MSKCEFIVVFIGFLVKTESHKRQTLAVRLGHDDETQLLQRTGEVIGGTGEVAHDSAVAVLAKADELVVLANDLRSALGEVQGERRLVCTEVVDVEHKFFGEVLWLPPDDPSYTWVYETIPV